MFDWRTLRVPIVAAPMAGGPSTPALVAAVTEAGGFGFLPGGYLTGSALAERIDATRELTGAPFGVNLFLPQHHQVQSGTLAGYRDRLQHRHYGPRGLTAPAITTDGEDHYQDKLAVLLEAAIPVVSFTFGLPDDDVIARLRDNGTNVVACVSTVSEVEQAARTEADTIVVQGEQAGGHRFTFGIEDDPEPISTLELLHHARKVTDRPVIAAGGATTPGAVAELLDAGAVAVQVGTALLLADEAGTRPEHRQALLTRTRGTVVTRAFSGRPARGLENDYIATESQAPPAYPALHHLTSPLRAHAASTGDAERLSMWTGSNYRDVRPGSARELVAWLACEIH